MSDYDVIVATMRGEVRDNRRRLGGLTRKLRAAVADPEASIALLTDGDDLRARINASCATGLASAVIRPDSGLWGVNGPGDYVAKAFLRDAIDIAVAQVIAACRR